MSSVSSVSRPDIAQLLRGAGGASGGRSLNFQPPKDIQQQFQSKFDSAAKELGIDSSQFASVGGKIQEALSNVDLSSSSDPQATIEQTVNDTLKANGIDPDKFKADFEKVLDKVGLPKPGEGGFPGGPGGPGGFGGPGGPGGPGGIGGASYAQSSQQDSIQKLLESLSSNDEDNSSTSSKLASFLAQAGTGTFLDTAA